MPIDVDTFESKPRRADTITSIQRFLESHSDQAYSVEEVAKEIYGSTSSAALYSTRTYLELLVRLSEIEANTTIEERQDTSTDSVPYYRAA